MNESVYCEWKKKRIWLYKQILPLCAPRCEICGRSSLSFFVPPLFVMSHHAAFSYFSLVSFSFKFKWTPRNLENLHLSAASGLLCPDLPSPTGNNSLKAALMAVSAPQSQVHVQEPSNRLSWSFKAVRSIKSTTSKCKRDATRVWW